MAAVIIPPIPAPRLAVRPEPASIPQPRGRRPRVAEVGQRFGRLVVIQEAEGQRKPCGFPVRRVTCLCDCGTVTVVQVSALSSGNTKSCGCLRRELQGKQSVTHGQTRNRDFSPNYKLWADIRKRTVLNKGENAPRYAGRGIRMYGPWADDFSVFDAWITQNLGPRPENCSLDRINNDGNYEPGNLRWATAEMQNNNTRANVYLKFNGETKTMAQWAREFGMSNRTLWARLTKSKWALEEALITPVRKHTEVST